MDLLWTRTVEHSLTLLLLLLGVVLVRSDFVEPPHPSTSLRSFADSQTRLPCRYQVVQDQKVVENQKVVQVTWYKNLPDGSKDQIITAHYIHGQRDFGRYSGRVKFENSKPTENSALLIPSTEVSDEGVYTCHITTYPSGNFERHITLTVWVLPISSLDPVILVEGQSYRTAASCRAVGRPMPQLSWDTTLPGRSQNWTSESGSVSTRFSLHPLRNMNGKRLDCLVWHPSLEQPRRIQHSLVVQYPPDASISATTADWYVGLENAVLLCDGGGFPKAHNISWTRKGDVLPDRTSVDGNRLVFGRSLRLNDSGVYKCVVANTVGEATAEYIFTVTEKSSLKAEISGSNLLLIIICASAGVSILILVIVVLLVNRHHRHRNKKLEMELSEKTEEINSLSRQTSLRRINSVSTDPRIQSEDYTLLRVDSRMKNSQMSLERPMYKGSQSTLGGKWGLPGGTEVDELGRPVIWHDGMRGSELDGEKEERRRRVESYLKSSNMSLDSGLPSSLIPLKAQQDDCMVGGTEQDGGGHLRNGHAPYHQEGWAGPGRCVQEEPEDEDDDVSSSYQLSAALTNHFYYSNGQLRPRPHGNGILLHPPGPRPHHQGVRLPHQGLHPPHQGLTNT